MTTRLPVHSSPDIEAIRRRPGALIVAAAIAVIATGPATISYALNPPLPEAAVPLDPFVVTADSVASSSQATLWIDARDQETFDGEHVPNALPLDEKRWDDLLPAVLEAWQPGMRIVVYCDGAECRKSRKVAERLRSEVGIAEAYYLHGGWGAWKKRNR